MPARPEDQLVTSHASVAGPSITQGMLAWASHGSATGATPARSPAEIGSAVMADPPGTWPAEGVLALTKLQIPERRAGLVDREPLVRLAGEELAVVEAVQHGPHDLGGFLELVHHFVNGDTRLTPVALGVVGQGFL